MNNVLLIGSEDIIRGGHIMQNAADTMMSASGNIESSLLAHQRFMVDWLDRFEAVLKEQVDDVL